MKHLLRLFAVMNIALLIVSCAITINGHFILGPFCFIWALYWLFRCDDELSVRKIQQFTLIELIAVLAIAAVLCSILLNLKTDVTKKDTSQIHSLLMSSQIYSLKNEGIYGFIINNQLADTIEAKNIGSYISVNGNRDIYFKSGVPVYSNGGAYVGCFIKISNPIDIDHNYTIKINTFTGKIGY